MPRSSSIKSQRSNSKQKPYLPTPEAAQSAKNTSDPTIFPCTPDINARLSPRTLPGLYNLDFVHKDSSTRCGNTHDIGVFYLGNIGDRAPSRVKTPASVVCKTPPINPIDIYILNVKGMYEVRTPDGNSVKFTFIVTTLEPVVTYRVIFHDI